MALAVLILALAAAPSAPAATVRDDASAGDDTPALNVDLGPDDGEDPADNSDDACVADDQTDDGSTDTTDEEADAAIRSRAASDDTTDDSGDDTTPADDTSGDETSDEDAVDPCEDTLDTLATTLRLRLVDILRSGIDGGTFRVTGPATVREELVLGSSGATAAARRAKTGKVVGVATKKVRSAGRVHLVVRLSAAGRRALRRSNGRRQLTLRTTVRPTRGSVQTRTRTVVLRRG
jgi:hypothetical protein